MKNNFKIIIMTISFMSIMTCKKEFVPEEAVIPEKYIFTKNVGTYFFKDKAKFAPDDMNFVRDTPSPVLSNEPYKWTEATIGYVSSDNVTGDFFDIKPAFDIPPDKSIFNKPVKITLDRLVAYNYPGYGRHNVLANFYAQNQCVNDVQDVNFNQVFKAEDGSAAGVSGYPIFSGLTVGKQGLAFKFFTVNVQNDNDKGILNALDSDTFKNGLSLTTTLNPLVKPITDLSLGIAKAILNSTANVKVQEVYLGLDFNTNISTRAKLREGSYIVVQIRDQNSWNWDNYRFNRKNGTIELRSNSKAPQNNYYIFSISKMEE